MINSLEIRPAIKTVKVDLASLEATSRVDDGHNIDTQVIEMGNKFFCSACDFNGGRLETNNHVKSFQQNRNAMHLKTVDQIRVKKFKTRAKLYPCGICGRTYDRWNRLINHIKMHHTTNSATMTYQNYEKDKLDLMSYSAISKHSNVKAQNSSVQLTRQTEQRPTRFSNLETNGSIGLAALTYKPPYIPPTLNRVQMSATESPSQDCLDFETVLVNDYYKSKNDYLAQSKENIKIHFLRCKFQSCGKCFDKEENLNFHMHTYHSNMTNKSLSHNQVKALDYSIVPHAPKKQELISNYVSTKPCQDQTSETKKPKTGPESASSELLEVDNLIHKDKEKLKCRTCDKLFTEKSSLMTHLLVHNDVNPHKCDTCGKAFPKAVKLRWHLRTHIRSHIEKSHKCEICGKAFKPFHLKEHILTHVGEKSHICEVCGKAFRKRKCLKEHLLIHSGDKPHKCDSCDKLFRHTSSLKTHLLTHAESGEKKQQKTREKQLDLTEIETKEKQENAVKKPEEAEVNETITDQEVPKSKRGRPKGSKTMTRKEKQENAVKKPEEAEV